MRLAIGGRYVECYVSGEMRRILTVLWDQLEGPKPTDPMAFVNNGCTLSPDYLSRYEVWPACFLHDFHTTDKSPVVMDRKEADAILRRNVEFLLKAQGCFVLFAKALAFAYWRGVRRGGRAFYSGKGDPA